MTSLINRLLNKFGIRISNLNGININPLDENGVDILKDRQFLDSCKEVKRYTLLDTPRLINLWEYCKISNPDGAIVEIGSYKGGGALHLSNCQPQRPVFIFESFEGFENVDIKLDANFNMQQFKDTSIGKIENLFFNKSRNVTVTPGFFPQSAEHIKLPPISFVHLDVDVYKATIESLQYLDVMMTNKSFILLDDCRRGCEGVDKAVAEFCKLSDNWVLLPLFPSQGLLIHRTWIQK